ncbi:hypothetical protein QWZ02_10605 [Kinneretia asaccharophila]|uniref:Uncharacterized protein n=1 Tax=Roseateles asaccharophilus TaxID=582607 RepID=A0A4R6NAR4_9BURK|nr:hypothetical protein [Roseateles asaccharophilus]MDN3544892.1 hypothetical protein [Roseateles asaccharophilus]TDP12721.1 hypothetical protein DFR39_101194 [Roseateles asaccharophilus]
MNRCFLAAAVLLLIIGLVHSLLGERLIFRRMRAGGFIPTQGGPVLRQAHVRILWASWHIVTVLGWGLAAMLFWLADASAAPLAASPLVQALALALLLSAALVLVGTCGRHPGWLGLLAAAGLVAAGAWA